LLGQIEKDFELMLKPGLLLVPVAVLESFGVL